MAIEERLGAFLSVASACAHSRLIGVKVLWRAIGVAVSWA